MIPRQRARTRPHTQSMLEIIIKERILFTVTAPCRLICFDNNHPIIMPGHIEPYRIILLFSYKVLVGLDVLDCLDSF